MYSYSIFGGCFRSDLEFPELAPHSGGSPDWNLRIVGTPPLSGDETPVGEDPVSEQLSIRLVRLPGGYRVHYSDTGSFDIPVGGREILWSPTPDADVDAVRLDVLGYVFATAFHVAGTLCLHGSAVACRDGGVGFMAPKGHGKSTLARALTASGARLASDDAILLTGGPKVELLPGVHEFRLYDDSASRFEDQGYSIQEGHGGKRVLRSRDETRLLLEPIPLSALYLLQPVAPGPDVPAVRRVLLNDIEATLALVRQTKAGPLLGGAEASTLLDRAGDLACRFPVHRLEVARSFDLIGEVVSQLMEWHGGPMPPVTTGNVACGSAGGVPLRPRTL